VTDLIFLRMMILSEFGNWAKSLVSVLMEGKWAESPVTVLMENGVRARDCFEIILILNILKMVGFVLENYFTCIHDYCIGKFSFVGC
jgi:hypothetical protein